MDACYFAGKPGYVYTLKREGSSWFIEPELGYAFLGSSPWYNGFIGTGAFKGAVGTMNVGYRFGQSLDKWDLVLRYENVFTNNVGRISLIGLRFARAFVLGKY